MTAGPDYRVAPWVSIAMLLSLGASSHALAQDAPTTAPITFERAGIAAGASVGYGVIGFRGPNPVRQKSGVFMGWLGWCFADRVVAGAEVEAAGPWDAGFDHRVFMAAVQYWLAPRVWVRGGLGVGVFGIIDGDGGRAEQIDRGTAYSATLGFETARFGQSKPWTADVQVRFAQSKLEAIHLRPHNVSVQVGVAWYTLRPRK